MEHVQINNPQTWKDKIRNRLKAPVKTRVMDTVMRFIKKCEIKGDYLEFGVYKGESLIRANQLAQIYKLKFMRFYGFDSFEGLPHSDPEIKRYKPGQYSCTLDTVRTTLDKYGVKAELIKGFFNESLNEETRKRIGVDKAAVILIDSDLHSSAVYALDFITPYVQDGTVMMFDSWFSHRGNPNRGEIKAMGMWLTKNPRFVSTQLVNETTYGVAFVLNDSSI